MFFTGTKTDLAQLIKNLSISPQKTEIQELEEKKLIPHLGSGSRSRGQKSSGSRIQIHNAEYGFKGKKTIFNDYRTFEV
jgi:hypothetical protein